MIDAKYMANDGELIIVPFQRDGIGGVLVGAATEANHDGVYLIISENEKNLKRGTAVKAEDNPDDYPFLALRFFEPESIDVVIKVLEECKDILTEARENPSLLKGGQ